MIAVFAALVTQAVACRGLRRCGRDNFPAGDKRPGFPKASSAQGYIAEADTDESHKLNNTEEALVAPSEPRRE
jgi:hypothetical protein